jgi:hypothetical protein
MGHELEGLDDYDLEVPDGPPGDSAGSDRVLDGGERA